MATDAKIQAVLSNFDSTIYSRSSADIPFNDHDKDGTGSVIPNRTHVSRPGGKDVIRKAGD